MSGSLRSIPSNGATDWTDWVTREQQTEKDFKFISLTNWGSTSIPQVAAGSSVIVNGALYEFDSAETITDLSGVAVSTQVWFKIVPSGSTCTVAAVTADASSWDADKGGYYDSNDLYIGGCYKDSGGDYIEKWLYRGRTSIEKENYLRSKIINIGDWDMDSDASVSVTHGLTFANIKSVDVLIRNDDNDTYYPIPYVSTTAIGAAMAINATTVVLYRVTGQIFDSVNFDSTSYNRGWITIWYEV